MEESELSKCNMVEAGQYVLEDAIELHAVHSGVDIVACSPRKVLLQSCMIEYMYSTGVDIILQVRL